LLLGGKGASARTVHQLKNMLSLHEEMEETFFYTHNSRRKKPPKT